MKAFQEAKDLLRSPKVLVHYDSVRPLVLSCDASPYGVGAILSHIMDDSTGRPVVFTFQTLLKAETNYAHLEKEAMSIIFRIQKFHNYLYSRKFIIHSDHIATDVYFQCFKSDSYDGISQSHTLIIYT